MSETTNEPSKAQREQGQREQEAAREVGADEVQARMDEAQEKGYFGEVPDETPNENYSLQTPPDAPTPETERGKE